MKRILIPIAACFLFLSASAQDKRTADNLSFVYDVFYQYCFDNREFARSGDLFMDSETINLARLAPSVGLSLDSGDGLIQSVMAGADLMRDMGKGSEYGHEFTLWYSLGLSWEDCTFTGHAGMFPRRFSVFGSESVPPRGTCRVPTVFMSDKVRVYDSNMEGLLLRFFSPRSYVEAGLDWMGMLGSHRRERFQIFTYGSFFLAGGFDLGWTATLYHFANTLEYRGVVDNVLLSPFITWTRSTGDFRYGAKLSWLQGIHQDRIRKTGLELASGALLSQDLKWRKVSVSGDVYYGTGQMPYYDDYDAGGNMYGSDLYFGCPFYKVNPASEDWKKPGFYGRAEFYWNPLVLESVDIRVGAAAHFNGAGFCGWQQKLSVVFDLDGNICKRVKRSR